ncbi:MAG: DUF4145 domain-containing protein [Candidatus Brocadiaceae bacterium]|nr:DUF4145 domain-containing protein [Candidatus Brocadiaceae bacterium]
MLRRWRIYKCVNCGNLVTAWAMNFGQEAIQIFPETQSLDETIPERPRAYLHQAIESLHSPAGAVMLAASAVDSMLKLKGYKEGSLYTRIEQAAKDHLITAEMAKWAHDVRLDANDQRHADDNAQLPNAEDAKRCVDFAQALAQFMFVLPARVQSGIAEAGG